MRWCCCQSAIASKSEIIVAVHEEKRKLICEMKVPEQSVDGKPGRYLNENVDFSESTVRNKVKHFCSRLESITSKMQGCLIILFDY